MSTSRLLPESIDGRNNALETAKLKKDNPGPVGNFLTTPTVTRLDAIQASYSTAVDQRNTAQVALSRATPIKLAAFKDCQLFTNHFIQVFNLGVRRGVYQAAERGFFGLDINSDALPPLDTEQQVRLMAKRITDKDAERVAAGGAAMSNPTTAQVLAKFTPFDTALTAYSGLSDALDLKQEAIENLNTEADKVIKKVWDEVDTFFNEETEESKRANAVEWGVVYVTNGNAKEVTINVVNPDGTPGAGKSVRFDEARSTKVANDQGKAVFNTTVEGEGNFSVDGVAFPPFNILPDVSQEFTIQLV